jgi:hypothetical protein
VQEAHRGGGKRSEAWARCLHCARWQSLARCAPTHTSGINQGSVGDRAKNPREGVASRIACSLAEVHQGVRMRGSGSRARRHVGGDVDASLVARRGIGHIEELVR